MHTSQTDESATSLIPALLPRGHGHQFVLYGDSCSGIPGHRHQQTFADVNAVVQRITPRPEFIVFPGDEIAGLVPDRDRLLAQWRHWLDVEMNWLNRSSVPMWHSTGNHTTYNRMSEDVFREVLAMPPNGPPGQEGLSYWVRRGNLLLVFVNTLWSGLGGEGFVETKWLGDVLSQNQDATHKLVVGHHPVFSVNGFSGPCQRDVAALCGAEFWRILVQHGVRAYLCSHILAFDVRMHQGVLQICTAGAGTAHRMPEGVEYLHCVQVALDDDGLRYQVLDTGGNIRETLDWRHEQQPFVHVVNFQRGSIPAPVSLPPQQRRLSLAFSGISADADFKRAQTLLCAGNRGALPSLWVGLRGVNQQLTAIIHYDAGRSPHYWLGPEIGAKKQFDIQLLLHWDMGPGGLLCKAANGEEWTSMTAASAWGLERLRPCSDWHIGHAAQGSDDEPFQGGGLTATASW